MGLYLFKKSNYEIDSYNQIVYNIGEGGIRMPTYQVYVKEHQLSQQQKTKIAQAITLVHTTATGAPNYFVQVIFNEQSVGERYLGGQPADHHIWVNAEIRGGRNTDQREKLLIDLNTAISKIAQVDHSEVWIYLNNLTPTDMSEYGKILPPPGQETAWFTALPKQVQQYLQGLGVDQDNFTL